MIIDVWLVFCVFHPLPFPFHHTVNTPFTAHKYTKSYEFTTLNLRTKMDERRKKTPELNPFSRKKPYTS